MKYTLYKILFNTLLRMPDRFFAAIFFVTFPIYKALHTQRAYGRTEVNLKIFAEYFKRQKFSFNKDSRYINKKAPAQKVPPAKEIFRGIYWNAIDSYRGLARLKRTTKKIIFENEKVIFETMKTSISANGEPTPLAAISIHQGPFELLHRSLCRYSDNVHLITDSVGDKAARRLLKNLRGDPNLTEYHPEDLPKLMRNLFTSPKKLGKSKNAILAMVVDQGKNTKGLAVSLFNTPSTLYLRLPQKLNRMGVGIVTFRTFTRPAANARNREIVIRFEKFYPPKYDELVFASNANTHEPLISSITKDIEYWIAEHPTEWSWNYHGNFRQKSL